MLFDTCERQEHTKKKKQKQKQGDRFLSHYSTLSDAYCSSQIQYFFQPFFLVFIFVNASGVLVVSLRTPTVALGRKTHRFPSLTPPPENLLTGYLSPPLLLFCFLFVAFPPVCVEMIGTLRSNDATAMRTSVKKGIFVLSVFIAIILTHLLCQMQANPPGVKFLGTTFKYKKRN